MNRAPERDIPGAVPRTADAGTGAPGELSYVYAVGRAGMDLAAAAEEAAGAGVAAAAVRVVCQGSLGALVSPVPSDRFGEAGIKAQLEDLERLESLARSHHAVVATAYRTAPVLPMRLATVYVDDTRVAAMLEERGAEFHRLLSRLDGQLEWGVKVYADPRRTPATADGTDAGIASDDSSVSPGRAYLRQRRARRDGQQRAYRDAEAVAVRVLGQAGALATDHVAHRVQQGVPAEGGGENIANHAFLVPADREEDFRAAVSEPARGVPGVRVEVTGPWAPYSFAVPESRPVPDGDGGHGAR